MLPDPATATYLGLPGYVYLWAMTVVSCSVFAVKGLEYVRVMRSARAEKRWDHLPQRLRLFAVNVLGQRRLVNEPVIGIAHFIIFWAFVLYATSFWWNLARGLVPSLPIAYTDDVRPVAIALEVFAVLGLPALAVAAVRRYIFTPAHLERPKDATLILALIALVLVSSLGR